MPRMLFSELYKITVNNVTFVVSMEDDRPPPGSDPGLMLTCLRQSNVKRISLKHVV